MSKQDKTARFSSENVTKQHQMVNCSMNLHVKKRKESKLTKEEYSPKVDSVDLDVEFTNI